MTLSGELFRHGTFGMRVYEFWSFKIEKPCKVLENSVPCLTYISKLQTRDKLALV